VGAPAAASSPGKLSTLAEMRAVFPHADPVGDLTVFNIAGNKYRLIARVNYRTQKVFVRAILTHGDYDLGRWKE
jgi:mRNA interferase HigB